MNKKRISFLKFYAGALTAAVVFALYAWAMYTFTKRDLLEILVTYGAFLMFPAYLVPFLIAGEDEDNDTE